MIKILLSVAHHYKKNLKYNSEHSILYFQENTTVILIFSVRESGSFQGFARVNGSSIKDGPKINWVLPPGISAKALSGVFKLDWISR